MSRSTRAVALLVVLTAIGTRWLRLNISPSVPYGFYVLRPVPAHLARGMLVVFPAPVSVRPWWSSWVPLLKPIAGLAGDRVCHQDHLLSVNDADFGPVLQTAHGRPLPHIDTGCQVVPEGSVFLASPMGRSLDSRYYGAVRMTDITAVAFPIVTWR